MKNRSVRTLLFYASVFVFLCVLLSGGSRLIGHVDETTDPQPQRLPGSIPARLTAVQVSSAEEAWPQQNRQPQAKKVMISSSLIQAVNIPVLCDANGNVLGHRSYMREVYQVFSLGDGFA